MVYIFDIKVIQNDQGNVIQVIRVMFLFEQSNVSTGLLNNVQYVNDLIACFNFVVALGFKGNDMECQARMAKSIGCRFDANWMF